jgi:hypothetical protein
MWVVLVLAGVLLLLSSFAVWINRVALNTGVFTDTSSELLADDAIRNAVATRAVDELFSTVDVQAELEAQLPEDFKSLSGPAAAGLRQASYEIVDRALERPALQSLFAATMEETHRTLVEVLEGGGPRVSTEGGEVTLDLRTIILEAADRIGIGDQVADKVPADAGRIVVLRSDELDTAQSAFQLLKTLAWVLPLLTLVAFGVAVWLARERRRAVRGVGAVLVAVGAIGLVASNLTRNYLVDSLVAERENRRAADNAWNILTDLMRGSFWWMIVVGVLFLVAAWLAGPGGRAVASRRVVAPVVQRRTWAYVALAIVALALLLAGSVNDFTRFLVLLVLVALGITWIEVTRSQTLHEFPDAVGAALLGGARTRLSGWWDDRRRQPGAAAAPASDVSARLASLAELHARGELTDEEFASAKARVLAGE